MQIYGKMMPHSEPLFSRLAKAMNKQKKFFCMIVGLASKEETGSETGKVLKTKA